MIPPSHFITIFFNVCVQIDIVPALCHSDIVPLTGTTQTCVSLSCTAYRMPVSLIVLIVVTAAVFPGLGGFVEKESPSVSVFLGVKFAGFVPPYLYMRVKCWRSPPSGSGSPPCSGPRCC